MGPEATLRELRLERDALSLASQDGYALEPPRPPADPTDPAAAASRPRDTPTLIGLVSVGLLCGLVVLNLAQMGMLLALLAQLDRLAAGAP